ncbi:MAG: tyrosine-type recombinase/integrase [Acidimicrobiales bacterium]|jgi:integrase
MAGSMRLVGDPDTWELRVYVGRDSEGRVRHLHRRFRGARRAAERALARLITEQETKPAAIPEPSPQWGPTTTVNDAITAWKANGWSDLSPNTASDYETVWTLHIQKSIGRRRIASLTPFDVEQYLRKVKDSGLSQERVRRIRAILHRACRLARKWSGNTLPNPITDTELPAWSLSEGSEEVRSPTIDEVRAILMVARAGDPRIAAFVRLVTATGLRRGEACALRWSDVDIDGQRIRVDKSVVIGRLGIQVKAPKTRASIRTIAVDRGTLDELQSLRARQDEIARACGVTLGPEGFVFSLEADGLEAPRPDSLSRTFARLRDKAGVASDIHLHSLRHFVATELDSVISESQKQARLGWSTVQMARHYTDSVNEEDQRAADHMGELIGATGRRGDDGEQRVANAKAS